MDWLVLFFFGFLGPTWSPRFFFYRWRLLIYIHTTQHVIVRELHGKGPLWFSPCLAACLPRPETPFLSELVGGWMDCWFGGQWTSPAAHQFTSSPVHWLVQENPHSWPPLLPRLGLLSDSWGIFRLSMLSGIGNGEWIWKAPVTRDEAFAMAKARAERKSYTVERQGRNFW